MAESELAYNRTVDPATGFIENPSYAYDFNVAKKLAFLEIYKQNGLKFWRTAAEIGVKGDTVHKHLSYDPAFKQALRQAEVEYFDDLESISRQNALNPRSVIERIFQLKARFPSKYGDGKRDSSTQITINIDGKALEMARKRNEVLDADIVQDGDNLARESVAFISDGNAGNGV